MRRAPVLHGQLLHQPGPRRPQHEQVAAQPPRLIRHLRRQAHLRRRGVLELAARERNRLQVVGDQAVRAGHLHAPVAGKPAQNLQGRVLKVQSSSLPQRCHHLSTNQRAQEAGDRGVAVAAAAGAAERTKGAAHLAAAQLHDAASAEGHELEEPSDSKRAIERTSLQTAAAG